MLQHRETPPRYPFGVTGPDVPSYSLESDPGDVVLFHQSLFHASFGGSQRRRMFTLNFTEPATTDAFVQMLRQLYDNHLRYQQTNPWYRLDYLYEPDFIAGGGPRRQRMVRPLVEWGFR